MKRLVFLVLYRGFARWLPRSTSPGGRLWLRVRRMVARPLLLRAGDGINVEHGAFFAAGQVVVGSNSGIGIDAWLQGPVRIGDDVMMGPEVLIFTSNHEMADRSRAMRLQGASAPRPVEIADDVWIGQRAIILPGVTIGRGAVVGAGAVVTKDVEPFTIVAGNPARVVGKR